jgi:hypothetical protein
VHLLPIEARPGTVNHARATARGLIEGGLVLPVYRFADERAFRVARVVTGLPTRLAERSVPIALYDLAWAIGVAERIAGIDAANARTTYAAISAAWNADQVRVLRDAIAGAISDTDVLARESAIVRGHDDALLRRCDEALREIERAVSASRRTPVVAQVRGRWLGRIAVTMSLAACSTPSRPVSDAAIDAVVDMPIDAPTCADPSRQFEPEVRSEELCTCDPDTSHRVRVTVDAEGAITAITDLNGMPLPTEIEQCFLDLVAKYCYPSLASGTHDIATCHVWIA